MKRKKGEKGEKVTVKHREVNPREEHLCDTGEYKM